MEKYGRARQATEDNLIQCVHVACSIAKAIETHPEYVILTAFPQQQWLHECTLILRLYVHCLSC